MISRTRNARLSPKDGKAPHTLTKVLLAIIGLLVVAGLLVWGSIKLFNELDRMTDEQCRIVDADLDVVVVTPGRMVQADVVTLHFGLTNGANLELKVFSSSGSMTISARLLLNNSELRMIRRP